MSEQWRLGSRDPSRASGEAGNLNRFQALDFRCKAVGVPWQLKQGTTRTGRARRVLLSKSPNTMLVLRTVLGHSSRSVAAGSTQAPDRLSDRHSEALPEIDRLSPDLKEKGVRRLRLTPLES